ncbi:helix-turn-helix domain-containing protein [Pedobacter sp. R-06]|uniref:helix-turn-helix domain-containing protein n=1 Tax=Pedobacter sp. R-06 TaxID=3404051 RepID=UPI003CF49BAC
MSKGERGIYRIAAVLKDKGIDNKVLAELMGVNPETVSRWCNNEIQPKPENLYRIAELTKSNIQELLIPTNKWPEGMSKAEEAQKKYDMEKRIGRIKK